MPTIKCFFLKPTGRTKLSLRRYSFSSHPWGKCPGPSGSHDAKVAIAEEGTEVVSFRDDGRQSKEHVNPLVLMIDTRWPLKCASCDYFFTQADQRQIFAEGIYVDAQGNEYAERSFPPGAMWYADWRLPHTVGPDGHCLSVMTPGGEWCPDDRASNCTLPDDNNHRCWVRHGNPETGVVHIDKNGLTCNAGAGSIAIGNFHGFLHNGNLIG